MQGYPCSYTSAHLALFITLAALLVQALGFALWCTIAVAAMYLRRGLGTRANSKASFAVNRSAHRKYTPFSASNLSLALQNFDFTIYVCFTAPPPDLLCGSGMGS